MKRIAVTGVGGGIGQSILKSLHGSDYTAVAIDPDPLAVGLHAAAVARLGPRADDPDFCDRIAELCGREGCRLLFPGVEPELRPLAEGAHRIEEAGTVPVVSRSTVVDICDDKQATASFLRSHGFRAPDTAPFSDDIDSSWFPCVLKPRRGGARSERTFVVTNKVELDIARTLVDRDNCIVQEYVDGDEYTCGSVTLGGTCHGVIVMRRVLRSGDTYKAFVIRDHALEDHVRSIAEALQPFGPCNFQLRLDGGEPCVFEINARCSGTTGARALAGFNEPRMVADYVVHERLPRYEIRELTILRYWNELVVENEQLASLEATGTRDGEARSL